VEVLHKRLLPFVLLFAFGVFPSNGTSRLNTPTWNVDLGPGTYDFFFTVPVGGDEGIGAAEARSLARLIRHRESGTRTICLSSRAALLKISLQDPMRRLLDAELWILLFQRPPCGTHLLMVIVVLVPARS
jgi:hypothetical protein